MAKNLLTLIVALLAMTGCVARAAATRSYADALRKAGNTRPVILFCYGANFGRVGRDMYQAVLHGKDKSLLRMLNKEIYVIVPIYQHPDAKEQSEYNRIMGHNKLPGEIWSFPCFAVMDGAGNFRAAVQSAADMQDTKTIADALSALLADFYKQQKLIAQAERVTGDARTRILREAYAVSSVRPPKHKMYDPSGDMVEKLQTMGIAQANAYVRGVLAGGTFTPVERQMILAAYAGHLRRKEAPTELLRAVYTEMRNVDPSTTYAAYAEGAIDIWVVPREGEKK